MEVGPRGTHVYFTAGDERPRRRVLEVDRGGRPIAVLRWSHDALTAAWLRLDDDRWVVIEPRATLTDPWGASDRLALADRFGGGAVPLTTMEALDWTRIDRIPTVAEPMRLPAGAGTVVLNCIAALAADQHSGPLRYRGPYPSEQLFLNLLESFHHHAAPGDPLAAFVGGELAWMPAPHERVFAGDGVVVHARDRIEKVVWRGRTYVRPDFPGVSRHAPRRVRDTGEGVACSLWALGEVIEDHLVLSPAGDILTVIAPPPPPSVSRPLPAVVVTGAAAIVAATSAPALRPAIEDEARTLGLAWAPLVGDLVKIDAGTARLSSRLYAVAAARMARIATRERPLVGLALLSEIALLLGDELRRRAQARVALLPAAAQTALLTTPPPPSPAAARAITDAVEAVLASLAD